MRIAFAASAAIGFVVSLAILVVWIRGKRSLSWPSVSGELLGATVVRTTSGRSVVPYWDVAVHYRYTVKGVEHSGTRRRFGEMIYASAEDAQSEAERLRSSAPTVYYHPERPGVSVLQPGPVKSISWDFFCWLGVFVVGLLLLALS